MAKHKRTLDERRAVLRAQLKQLDAQAAERDAGMRTKRLIVVGAAMFARAERGHGTARAEVNAILAEPMRASDRKAFEGLRLPWVDNDDAASAQGASSVPDGDWPAGSTRAPSEASPAGSTGAGARTASERATKSRPSSGAAPGPVEMIRG